MPFYVILSPRSSLSYPAALRLLQIEIWKAPLTTDGKRQGRREEGRNLAIPTSRLIGNHHASAHAGWAGKQNEP